MEGYVMSSNALKLHEKRIENQYIAFYNQYSLDLRKDDVPPRRELSIRQRMIKGYMQMLSNQK